MLKFIIILTGNERNEVRIKRKRKTAKASSRSWILSSAPDLHGKANKRVAPITRARAKMFTLAPNGMMGEERVGKGKDREREREREREGRVR